MIPYLFHLPGVKNRDLSTGLPRAGASVELQSASRSDVKKYETESLLRKKLSLQVSRNNLRKKECHI